jgi:hypothetical protein
MLRKKIIDFPSVFRIFAFEFITVHLSYRLSPSILIALQTSIQISHELDRDTASQSDLLVFESRRNSPFPLGYTVSR